MVLANSIVGLEVFGTTWWIIAVIVCVILLITIGIAYSDSIERDFDDVCGSTFVAVVASVFWPIALGIVAAVGIIAAPIVFGKYLGKWAERQEKKREEKKKFMNQIDRMKKTKGVD